MDLISTFQQLGVALGLGLLVGLQRERTESRLAGFRTFPLITVFGFVCGLLGQEWGGWVVGIGALALAMLLLAGQVLQSRAEESDPGLTTEVAALLMFVLGAYLSLDHNPLPLAIVIGGGVAVLLHLKPQMHTLAQRLGEGDFKAIMQFVLITLVVLPVLPNRTYGPFEVLNPRHIWLMVVLIVGISLGAYVAYKLFGDTVGTVLGGMLGGLISSTATTLSYSRRARAMPEAAYQAAVVIMIASTIVFLRVILLIVMVTPHVTDQLAPPIAVMFAIMAVISSIMWLLSVRRKTTMPPQANPSELKAALVMALLYAVILLAVAAAQKQFGERGLFAVAGLSGLTDMDAITLSTARFVDAQRLVGPLGWQLILVASLSNLVLKTILAAMVGNRQLLRHLALPFALSFLAGLALLWLWPGGSA